MYSKILLRYGELSTKGKNKMSFVRQLEKNIKNIVGVKPTVEYDRMFLEYSEETMQRLKYIFGIVSYSPVITVNTDLEEFKQVLLSKLSLEGSKTFKVRTKRHWKGFPKTSMEVNQELGGFVLNNSSWTVDVKNPDLYVEIEIRENESYIFIERHKGLGGYPTGINGKVLHLISGGFDSPIAALEMMKRGIHVDFLNFITPPATDDRTIEKVNDIINFLTQYQGKSILFRSIYSKVMKEISSISNEAYRINLMRRSFYRIANTIAEKHHYLGISNGENLGQVASQTLESINTIQAISKLPIYRPLLTADKVDTINRSKEIGLHDLLIKECTESCEAFAPKSPIIKPTIEESEKLEKELENLFVLEENNVNEEIEYIRFPLKSS